MKPVHVSSMSVVVAILASLAFLEGAAAQTTTSAVLNSVELQDLIKRAEPADHARLEVHFAVLAEQYEADAKIHRAMAQAFVSSPVKRTAANSAVDHCKRLAELNTQSAATLRKLAAYHENLAAGKAATAPRGAARFEGGEGAPPPTAAELSALAAKANTPADHHRLEEYFQTLAKRYTAEANEHTTMAQAYRGTRISQAAAHCDRLAMLSSDSAKEATAAAAMHKNLAGIAR